MKRWVTCLLLSLIFLMGTCGAESVLREQADGLNLDALEQAAEEYLGEVDLSQGIDLDQGLESIFETGSEQLYGVVRKAVRSGVLLLVVVLFCAMADGMNEVGQAKEGISVVTLAGAIAVTTVAVADVHGLIGMGREAIGQIETLSKVLVPAMTVVTAAAGAPAGAAARQLATMFFADVLLTVINRVLLPLVYAYVASSSANAALGNEGVKKMAELIKWFVTSVLTLMLLAFVGYLSVSGVIAGSTDAVAIKAAKFAVSGMVPVVGGILSDAAETVLAGAGILRNSVGVAGMLAVLAICVSPFLQLGIHYLTYKLTSALTATVSESRVAGLISAIGGAFGLVLGMTGACALLLLISMVSAISMVVK